MLDHLSWLCVHVYLTNAANAHAPDQHVHISEFHNGEIRTNITATQSTRVKENIK